MISLEVFLFLNKKPKLNGSEVRERRQFLLGDVGLGQLGTSLGDSS